MKKAILSLIGILAIILMFSFTDFNVDNERIVKITSEKPLEFDMFENGKIIKGLQTPYEFKFNEEKGNFIFRTNSENNDMKLSVKDAHGSLTANWNVIVLTIQGNEMSTFGME